MWILTSVYAGHPAFALGVYCQAARANSAPPRNGHSCAPGCRLREMGLRCVRSSPRIAGGQIGDELCIEAGQNRSALNVEHIASIWFWLQVRLARPARAACPAPRHFLRTPTGPKWAGFRGCFRRRSGCLHLRVREGLRRGSTGTEAPQDDQNAAPHPETGNGPLCELRTRSSARQHPMSATEALVWRYEPLVSVNRSQGNAFHGGSLRLCARCLVVFVGDSQKFRY
ncbi:hypothetical protein SAMN05518669_12948 [Variovorax sp. YR634]|nr:hypothetical protein SAMN05518669_12948 [Variovorax sp. YR634]